MTGQVTQEQRSTLLEIIANLVDADERDTLQGIDIDPTPVNVIVQSQVWDHAENCSRVFVTAIRPDGSTDSYEEH